MRFIDLTGQKFNRLTVIKRVENYIQPNGKTIIQWLCECDCGSDKEIIVTSDTLKSGNTKSCGCLRKENTAQFNKESKKKYNNYDLLGKYGIGYTETGEVFYFDLEDYDKIKNYSWYINNREYVVSNSYYKYTKMHRLVMNCPDDMEVDHIYHNKNDNRKEFLRIVTKSQNQMNRSLQSNNTSGVTGVSWDSTKEKWCAYITYNNQRMHLGYFDDFESAVDIRSEAEEKYFGEYNFIERKLNNYNIGEFSY